MRIEKLPWDSDFFGLRIGRAMVSSDNESDYLARQEMIARNEYDLVYVFARHGVTFSASGAKKVDEKIVYYLSDFPSLEASPNVILWNKERGVTDDLLQLALLSGKYSRFRMDDGFPMGSFDRLYSRWIEQSVNKSIASGVFCYMVEGTPLGLITLNKNNHVGAIGLVAVSENCQHRGVGTTLIQSVIHYARQTTITKLSVTTQGVNRGGCRLYEKNGFVVDSVTDVWHWWL